MRLLALPADAVLGVLEEDAFFEEVVADGVGAGEVALLLGLGALGDEGVDGGVGEAGAAEFFEDVGGDVGHAAFGFGPAESGPGEFGVAVRFPVIEDREDGVEFVEESDGFFGVEAGEAGVVGGRIDGAEDVEDGGAGFGGVEVVGEGGGEVGVALADCFRQGAGRRGNGRSLPFAALRSSGRILVGDGDALGPVAGADAVVEGAQALDGVGGFGEAVEGEVELVAVGHAEQKEADGRCAIALEKEVAEGEEVALGLGHFFAFDEQEADVEPVAREGVVRGGFRLGDLIFVVREHEVFTAGVEVEGVAEIFDGHGGALDVPAGAAGAEGRFP